MLWCVYHKTLPMRVVGAEEHEKHITSGEWFDLPIKDIKTDKIEVTHEKQKRRRKK